MSTYFTYYYLTIKLSIIKCGSEGIRTLDLLRDREASTPDWTAEPYNFNVLHNYNRRTRTSDTGFKTQMMSLLCQLSYTIIIHTAYSTKVLYILPIIILSILLAFRLSTLSLAHGLS